MVIALHSSATTPCSMHGSLHQQNDLCCVYGLMTRPQHVPMRTGRRPVVVGHSSRTARPVETSAIVEWLAMEGIEVPVSVAKRNPDLSITSEEQIANKVEPMLKFLVKEQAMQPQDIETMLLRCPRLFSFSVERQSRPVMAFLASLGFSQQQASDTIKRFPHLLGYDTKGHLIPHYHYLKSLGLTDEELPRLILARPHVLGTSIELVITYLRKWLRIERTHVGKLLWSYPLDYSLPRLVMPTLVEQTSTDTLTSSVEDETDTASPSASSSDTSSSSATAQQDPKSSGGQEQQQQQPMPLPPWGSPDRCTWLELNSSDDSGSKGSSSDGGSRKPEGN